MIHGLSDNSPDTFFSPTADCYRTRQRPSFPSLDNFQCKAIFVRDCWCQMDGAPEDDYDPKEPHHWHNGQDSDTKESYKGTTLYLIHY